MISKFLLFLVDPHIKKEVVYKTYTETSKKELPTLIEEKPTCFEYMGVSVVAEVNVRKAIEDAKCNFQCIFINLKNLYLYITLQLL